MGYQAGSIGERRLLRQRRPLLTSADHRPVSPSSRAAWLTTTGHLAVIVALLCLAAANLWTRWTWFEMEDGVLWATVGDALTAREVAEGSAAAEQGIRPGDILEALNEQENLTPQVVTDALHAAKPGDTLTYRILRLDTSEYFNVQLKPVPTG